MSRIKGKLNTAIGEGDYETVKTLFKTFDSSAISSKFKDSDVFQLLNKAVKSKYPLITKYLLSKFNKVNFSLASRDDPLLITAIDNKDMETIKVLIGKGADLNFSYKKRHSKRSDRYLEGSRLTTPLYEAMKTESMDIVKYLLKRGSDKNFKDQKGRMPLDFAIRERHPEFAELLVKAGAAMSPDKHSGYQPIHTAAHWCSQIVGPLIERGADIHATDNYGSTALHIACYEDELDVVKLLVERGADPNAKSRRNETPLHQAVFSPNILQYLIESGAEVNATNNSGETPLFAAAYYCWKPESVKLLLRHGGKLEATDDLVKIASQAPPEILKILIKQNPYVRFDSEVYSVKSLNNAVLLIESGMNVNTKVKYNESTGTPFILAVKKGYAGIAASLLDAGADVNEIEKFPQIGTLSILYTSMILCRYAHPKYLSIVCLCLEYGADVNILPENDVTLHFMIVNFKQNTFVRHIAKMRSQKLEVDRRILDLISSNEKLAGQYKSCKEEIGRLKVEKFTDTSFTFYDVLTRDVKQLASWTRNETVVEACKAKKKYEKKFPIYGTSVTERLKMGMRRKLLLSKIYKSRDLFFPRLPINCIAQILDHLASKDLNAMIYVCKFIKMS